MDEIPDRILLDVAAQGVARQLHGHKMFALAAVASKVEIDPEDFDIDEEVAASQGVGMEILPLGEAHTLIQFRNNVVQKLDDDVMAVFLAVKAKMPGEETRQEVMGMLQGMTSLPDLAATVEMIGQALEKNGDRGKGAEQVAVFGMNRDGDAVAVVLQDEDIRTRPIEGHELDTKIFKALRYVLDKA